MHQQGILKTDDLITRFFRLCTEMCVDLCYRALSEQTHNPLLIRNKCFHTLDAFVRLIALLVKHSGDNTNTVTKINLLNKVNKNSVVIFNYLMTKKVKLFICLIIRIDQTICIITVVLKELTIALMFVQKQIFYFYSGIV